MPITRDIRGESGLDVVLGHRPLERPRLPDGLYWRRRPEPAGTGRGGGTTTTAPAAAEGQCLSAAFAGKIFAAIAPYGYMHSGAVVAGAIPAAVEAGVPGIFAYLSARFRAPEHCPHAMQPALRARHGDAPGGGGAADQPYQALALDPWARHTAVARAFFAPPAAGGKPLQRYRLRFYDIPWLHEDGPEGRAFMRQLAAGDPADRAALDSPAVQMIVRERWRLARPRWARYVAWPFLVTLAVNALWTLWIAPNRGANAAFAAAHIACCVEMLAYAALACHHAAR